MTNHEGRWYATLTSKDGKMLDDCAGDRLLVEGVVKMWVSILIEGDTIRMDAVPKGEIKND